MLLLFNMALETLYRYFRMLLTQSIVTISQNKTIWALQAFKQSEKNFYFADILFYFFVIETDIAKRDLEISQQSCLLRQWIGFTLSKDKMLINVLLNADCYVYFLSLFWTNTIKYRSNYFHHKTMTWVEFFFFGKIFAICLIRKIRLNQGSKLIFLTTCR